MESKMIISVLMIVAMVQVAVGCSYSPKAPAAPTLKTLPVTPSIPTSMMPMPTTATPPIGDFCPIDALKLGACLDVLGGLVHLGLGDSSVNQCCPVLKGIAKVEATLCLCTVLKANLFNLDIYVPLAFELLAACQKTPPKRFTCPK